MSKYIVCTSLYPVVDTYVNKEVNVFIIKLCRINEIFLDKHYFILFTN